MKMNFLGLHTYPEQGPQCRAAGVDRSAAGCESRWHGEVQLQFVLGQHAARRRLGLCGEVKTSDFTCGAAQLFPDDAYGPDVMKGLMPASAKRPRSATSFSIAPARSFGPCFALARQLGVKTCIGTETPLTIPAAVREHLKQLGKNPADPAVVRELYDGMFKRIAAVCPVDYYWLWTPEGWTWGGNNPAQFEATIRDIRAAYDALAAIGKPCTLATCGWVLGPQHDRAALDNLLPKECPMSCINRTVGHDPVEAAFANIQRPPQVGDSLDGKRSEPGGLPALGRPHAARRGRCQAAGLRRPVGHSLADEGPRAERLRPGRRRLGPVVGSRRL